MAVVLAASVPVFALVSLLGGVGRDQIGWSLAICTAAALAAGSWGTLVAFWREKTFQTLAISVLGTVLFLGVLEAGAVYWGSSSPVGRIAAMLNPYRALLTVLELPALRRQLASQGKHVAIPPTGVYIDDVFAPSPASHAGVRPGDFLVALGGHPVLAVGDFQTWLYVTGIGREAELELLRDGKPLRLRVPVEVRPPAATTH